MERSTPSHLSVRRPIREHRPDGLVDPLDPGGHGRILLAKNNPDLPFREIPGKLAQKELHEPHIEVLLSHRGQVRVDSPHGDVHDPRGPVPINLGSILLPLRNQGVQLQLPLRAVLDRDDLPLELLHGLDGTVHRDEEPQRVHGIGHGKGEFFLPLRRNPHEAGDGVHTAGIKGTEQPAEPRGLELNRQAGTAGNLVPKIHLEPDMNFALEITVWRSRVRRDHDDLVLSRLIGRVGPAEVRPAEDEPRHDRNGKEPNPTKFSDVHDFLP